MTIAEIGVATALAAITPILGCSLRLRDGCGLLRAAAIRAQTYSGLLGPGGNMVCNLGFVGVAAAGAGRAASGHRAHYGSRYQELSFLLP